MAKRRKTELGLILFLHDLGYNLFNIGKLTYLETEYLVEAWNARNEAQKKAAEVAKNKNKKK